ncbi:aminoglycoside phosphotransferase family protein [Vreelandella andesensis]|uniref:Aminoglycoside phosphotransferase family protein n=1 Tax=Vreelandella andesensis TaxID=447567 RepID=A0A433KPB5_9GAMM|nr:aminoglycoside phosphotransferase family protein [Halomonas andesensis]RUR31484.1 aminoglycoside phosphotransferase family protein [Halomonas andesensis]
MPTLLEARLQALESTLQQANITYQSLSPMADTGLAHDHVWIHRDGDDWVARLPKQSQMNLAPAENLAYEAACYERASQGGHMPCLHGILPVCDALPRGGLLVEAIEGRLAQLPEDLPRIAEALASLHQLPLPSQSAPLLAPSDPWQAMREEINRQAEWLEKADLSVDVIARVRDELEALPATLPDTQRCLISFDTHPGNFLITEEGRAILVDLEKCRYGLPGIDLAHTSLYTSTTWDLNSQAVLTLDEVASFYQRWQARMSQMQKGETPSAETLIACRRATWLWSLTWCAKWRAQHLNRQDAERRGEDWSAELTDAAVIAHVRDRVEHYLSLPIIQHVHNELIGLKASL